MSGNLKGSWFWQDVRESLVDQPVKSGLTFFSMAIGMMALSIMLSILAGLEKKAARQVDEIGADVAIISAPEEAGSATVLTRQTVDRLRQLAPGSICAGVRSYVLQGVHPAGTLHALAADTEFPLIRGWTLESGRWLDEADLASASLHAVVSHTLAERLFLKVGDVLPVRETLFRVVGIVEGSGRYPGGAGAGDLFFMFPPSVPAWWMTEPAHARHHEAIHIKNRSHPDLDRLSARIRRDLEGDRPGGPPAWTIITPDTLIASTRAMMRTVRLVYGSVAVLCLVLGGATLSSLMLVAIQQRIAEIGLRMAIGASWRDIFLMFLCEGLFTTVASGMIGLGAGLVLLGMLGNSVDLPVAFQARVAIIPLATSILLGLAFSWYPARTAASIMPADALRQD